MGLLSGLIGGGGGGTSASAFDKTQVNQTTTESTSAGVQGDSNIVAAKGATVTALDGGAIGKAFDFADSVVSTGIAALTQGFSQNVGQLNAVLAKQTVDSGERIQSTVKIFVIGAGVIGLAFIAYKAFAK